MSQYPRFPVLLVDDEDQFLQSASFSLRTSGIGNIERCSDSRQVMNLIESKQISAVLLDIMMPYLTGKELLPRITQQYPNLPVIILTALNEIDSAVECMRSGAFDYLVKPIDKQRLVSTINRALEYGEVKHENTRLKESLLSGKLEHPEAFNQIITGNKSMRAVFSYIEAIAGTSLPVLISGETGTGKELIAKAIHMASGRTGECVPVNVAGLDDNLFSDTLFGHEKGAFTGADSRRVGLIGKAINGTLFLDEIGDLKMESQVKLLRLLEERSYYPIGSDSPLTTNARIIVATNADIAEKQRKGEFRSDLYYRLAGHQIRIPALRDRKEDIRALVNHFLEKSSEELGKKIPTPPEELFLLLNTYRFPGNVRELRGMVYDAVSRHKSGMLSMDSFKEYLSMLNSAGMSFSPESESTEVKIAGKIKFGDELPSIKEAEDLLVKEALERSGGNQSIAASMLGLTRSALNKRINRKDDE